MPKRRDGDSTVRSPEDFDKILRGLLAVPASVKPNRPRPRRTKRKASRVRVRKDK